MRSAGHARFFLLGLAGVAALTAALAATDAHAQMGLRGSTFADDDSDTDLRRRAQQRRAKARQPKKSVGRTGFNSTNVPDAPPPPAPGGPAILPPASQNVPRAVPRRSPPPPPPPAAGARNPRHAGNEQPQLSRPGASPAPGTATPLIRTRQAQGETDPFDATGIRAGAFTLRPAIEMTTGYDSNPARFRGTKGSWFYTVSPELLARSNWSRHSLEADIRGSYVDYPSYNGTPSLARPTLDAKLRGRIDATRDTQINIEARNQTLTDYPNSPDLPTGIARLPIRTTFGGDVGVTHRINRLELTLKGTAERTVWQDSELVGGASHSNRDRNYNQYGAALRAAYELTPGIKPFAEIAYDQRIRDIAIDSFGLRRDSTGVTGRLGTSFEITRKLTGEVSIGYLSRTFKDASLPELRGVVADASLIWQATGLTSVKFTAKSTADETALDNVSGILRRDYGIQVDHAFRRWLIGTARFGYGEDEYDGQMALLSGGTIRRLDQRYVASVGVTYKLNRSVQLKGEIRREWMKSNYPGVDYTATIALIGLRLQR